MTNNYELQGFITNLGKYNEGDLVGEWISFPIDEDELQAVYNRIGINEYYEEYFFTDWQQSEDIFNLGEYVNVDEVNEAAERVQELDDYELETLEAVCEANGRLNIWDEINIDNYQYYSGQTLEDVAYDLVHDCYDLPEFAERYFDYEAFARDLSIDGYAETSNGVIVCC